MSNTVWLIITLVLALGFVLGGILFLRSRQGFKLPDNWQEIKKKNQEKWQQDDWKDDD